MINTKAQGAIEYLLLIGAALIVVAIVISFIISTISPTQESGSKQTYDYLCGTLDTNDFTCGCYTCNKNKGGLYEGAITMANRSDCDDYAENKKEPLLAGSKCPVAFPN